MEKSVFQTLISPQIQIDNLGPFSNYSNRAECICRVTFLKKNQVVPIKRQNIQFYVLISTATVWKPVVADSTCHT